MQRKHIEELWAAKGGTGLPPMAGGSEASIEAEVKAEKEAREAADTSLKGEILTAANVKKALVKEQQEEQKAAEEANQTLAATNAAIQGIGLRFQGAYSAGATYAIGDVVTEAGSSYLSLAAANQGHTPSAGSPWFLRGETS